MIRGINRQDIFEAPEDYRKFIETLASLREVVSEDMQTKICTCHAFFAHSKFRHICQRNHDRFLIIDDVVYLFGASLKDAGKKLFAYIKMQETPAAELLNNIR